MLVGQCKHSRKEQPRAVQQQGKNYQTTRRDDVRARDASAHLESVSAAQQTHVLNFALPCAQRLRPTDSIRMCPDSATFISTHSKQG